MNLAVITCHFNPGGFNNPRRNLLRFMRQLQVEGIPLFIAELAYDDEPWFLPDSPSILRFRSEKKNVMWHKENLLNNAESIVPAEFDAIAWVDADVWFERLDWYQAVSDALDHYAVVQLFDTVAMTSRDGRISRMIKSAGSERLLAPGITTPGLAWAARRSLWQEAGGLFERAIIGGGDMLQASVWLPSAPLPLGTLNYRGVPGSLERLKRWCASNGGCGAVDGTIWHEWHGDIKNRSYVERHAMVKNLDLDTQIVKRADGLLEFSDSVPAAVSEEILAYFVSRNEDGLEE